MTYYFEVPHDESANLLPTLIHLSRQLNTRKVELDAEETVQRAVELMDKESLTGHVLVDPLHAAMESLGDGAQAKITFWLSGDDISASLEGGVDWVDDILGHWELTSKPDNTTAIAAVSTSPYLDRDMVRAAIGDAEWEAPVAARFTALLMWTMPVRRDLTDEQMLAYKVRVWENLKDIVDFAPYHAKMKSQFRVDKGSLTHTLSMADDFDTLFTDTVGA